MDTEEAGLHLVRGGGHGPDEESTLTVLIVWLDRYQNDGWENHDWPAILRVFRHLLDAAKQRCRGTHAK